MKKIIKADMYHLFSSKVYYITLVIGIIICTLINLSGSTFVIMGDVEFPPIMNMKGGAYNIYFSIGTAKNIIFLLLPIYFFLINKDFSEKIIYNILARGIKRSIYFVAKMISISIVSCMTYIIVFLSPMIIAVVVNGFELQEEFGVYIKRLLITIFIQIVIICVFGVIAFYINIIFQKSSVFIMLYIFGTLVSGYLFVLSKTLESTWLKTEFFLEYWLLAIVNNQLFVKEDYQILLLVLLSWLCAPGLIALSVFNKRDIGC